MSQMNFNKFFHNTTFSVQLPYIVGENNSNFNLILIILIWSMIRDTHYLHGTPQKGFRKFGPAVWPAISLSNAIFR